MAEPRLYAYVGIDASGRRVKATLAAADETAAFETLRRSGVSPLQIREARSATTLQSGGPRDRDIADLLSNLGDLLAAGADIRSALSMLGARGGKASVRSACQNLAKMIGGGEALDTAFVRALGSDQTFVGALIAAGEAGGDLPGGLKRAAGLIEARLQLREQLISSLSYPAFVLASTVAAAGVILFFVVPSLAPLVEDAGQAPWTLASLIAVSRTLREHALLIFGALGVGAAATAAAGFGGLLSGPIDRFLLDGPAAPLTRGIAFGGFAIALGDMLAAGAPMTDALRLALRSVRSDRARGRLTPVAHAVRQGQSLSSALEGVHGFPRMISQMAAVGEATGALGSMLGRSGRLEEAAAVKRIDALAKMLGPVLIVVLGGMVGLLMAGLLSGVSGLGEAALQ